MSTKIVVQIKYSQPISVEYSVEEEWEKSDVFCPKCGQKALWEELTDHNAEDNAGGYFICTNCYFDGHLTIGYRSHESTKDRCSKLLSSV